MFSSSSLSIFQSQKLTALLSIPVFEALYTSIRRTIMQQKKVLGVVLLLSTFALAGCGQSNYSTGSFSRSYSYGTSSYSSATASSTYISRTSSSTVSSYTPTRTYVDFANYIISNGRYSSSSGFYTYYVNASDSFIISAAVKSDKRSFQIASMVTVTADGLTSDLLMMNNFTWGSVESGTYIAGIIFEATTSSSSDTVINLNVTPTTFASDHEILTFSCVYKSSSGISSDNWKSLATSAVNNYNKAFAAWNIFLANNSCPLIC